MKEKSTGRTWEFFRAGGFDQVRLEFGADLANLDQLDQKLWVALACPIAGLEFDPKTAALVDADKDGRIRAPELIAAVKWAAAALKDSDTLIRGGDQLSLDAISEASEPGRQILSAAKRIVADLKLPPTSPITLAHAIDANAAFAASLINGDGVIVPECATDPEVAALIKEILECVGSVKDRSGAPGVDQALADKFFADCAAFDASYKQAEANAATVLPLGDKTPAAAAAMKGAKAKIDDYFGRCRLAEFDPRTVEALNRTAEEYAAISATEFTIDTSAVAGFPLARIEAGKPLPLTKGLNPAHAAKIAALRVDAIQPLIGNREELTEADWAEMQARLAAYETWWASRNGASVEKLGIARVRALLGGKARDHINALIAQDKAADEASANAASVEKLLRYVRDLHLLCRNFVNFSDLYHNGGLAIFQCGTLYIDQRACFLCLTVENADRHAAMAGLSGAYLAYCDCIRKGTGEKLSIVAIVSQGEDENLMVGRNGIFYDRKGHDYDATITKIISSPISVRQAFWSPYSKFAKAIEQYIAKRATAADTDIQNNITASLTAAQTPAAAPPAPGSPAKPLFDPSTVALFSVAFGSLAAAGAAVLTFLGKVPPALLPFMLFGIMLLISGPSLLLAFIKLRKRNLGPILDANGWAINAKAKINVPFGERLTIVARLPRNAVLDTRDAYAEKRALWPKFLVFILLLAWIYSLLDYTGILYRMTKDWEIPLGSPPAVRNPAHTNTSTNSPPENATNAPAK